MFGQVYGYEISQLRINVTTVNICRTCILLFQCVISFITNKQIHTYIHNLNKAILTTQYNNSNHYKARQQHIAVSIDLLHNKQLKIHQRGVQWKQGVVICMLLCTSLLYKTTPIHCTPLPLHPPLMNTHLFPCIHNCSCPEPRKRRIELITCWPDYCWPQMLTQQLVLTVTCLTVLKIPPMYGCRAAVETRRMLHE